jgi:hypothetical protein
MIERIERNSIFLKKKKERKIKRNFFYEYIHSSDEKENRISNNKP